MLQFLYNKFNKKRERETTFLFPNLPIPELFSPKQKFSKDLFYNLKISIDGKTQQSHYDIQIDGKQNPLLLAVLKERMLSLMATKGFARERVPSKLEL